MSRTIVVVAGTRPEIIKLAPVYRALKERNQDVAFWTTGQHTSLADGPLEFFEVQPQVRLRSLQEGQSSNMLLSKLLAQLDHLLYTASPAALIVQGDTTSALAGALAAFHRTIPVAHVEAGLRSGDLTAPFPEEMNRRVIDSFARWLFPPTPLAHQTLLREGHEGVHPPTGNTGIDALAWARRKVRHEAYWPAGIPAMSPGMQLVLSTGHRRENLGGRLQELLRALAVEISARPDTLLIHVAHPNPSATEDARAALGGFERVHIVPAVDYPGFVALLDRAAVVVSDSGGIQEEAPSFQIPILITRDVTERPEVLSCGGVLVGTEPDRLRRALQAALAIKAESRQIVTTPFGDGRASERIVERILRSL